MNKFSEKITKKIDITYRSLTSFIRLIPDFIIIGSQKGGTTTLYDYLIQHPCVAPTSKKELHFFDNDFSKGLSWYRSQFPTKFRANYHQTIYKHKIITGEASPYYIFHPLVPQRIAKTLPNVKLIVILRNPVYRAYSHYQMNVKQKLENLSFEEAIQIEAKRINAEKEKFLKNESYVDPTYARYSYLSRGIYVDQLETWMNFFDKKQILILQSEIFFMSPVVILNQLLEFLEIPDWNLPEFKHSNAGNYPRLKESTKRNLLNYFKPHNQRLYELIGFDCGWDC